MSVWWIVAQVAAAQTGLVATWQLVELGVPSGTLSARAQREGWRQVHRGVWALPGSVDSPQQRLMAAVLALGAPTSEARALLGRVACALRDGRLRPGRVVPSTFSRCPVLGVQVAGPWAAYVLGIASEPRLPPTLAVPSGRALGALDNVEVHGTRWFDDATRARVGLMPVTAVDVTLCDLGRWHDEERVATVIATACRLRRTSIERVARELDRRGRFPGCGVVRDAVRGLRGELVHSQAERLARRALLELGLRPHPRPLDLVVDGRVIAQADIPFVAERLDVEIDGPHHFLAEQAAKDRVRDRRVKAALHWDTARFSVYEVERDPRAFALEVRDMLRDRSAA